jgi:hypothetical protein
VAVGRCAFHQAIRSRVPACPVICCCVQLARVIQLHLYDMDQFKLFCHMPAVRSFVVHCGAQAALVVPLLAGLLLDRLDLLCTQCIRTWCRWVALSRLSMLCCSPCAPGFDALASRVAIVSALLRSLLSHAVCGVPLFSKRFAAS